MPHAGFNVIGFISANLGLGAAARASVRILLENGYPVSTVDVDAGFGRSGFDRSLDHLACDPGRPPHHINLIHLNPPELESLWKSPAGETLFHGKHNVIVPFWELPKLPGSWLPTLGRADLILAPSHYIEYMMSTQVNGTAVRHYPQTVFVPEVDPSRPAFGLPENDILFITSFELLSDMNRKNTGAVIESFRQAFPGKEGVGLVVNVNNPHPHPAASEQLRELHSRASNDPRIVLIEKNLTYREVLSLYAACDAIVSLHRGEGLGLSPMEGMTLGKPVIATAWSGVMDFMSDRNSCLVPCTLVPLPAASASGYNASYVGGATVWAEPDVGCAAVWMRRLAEDASLRKKIGDAAAGDLRQRHQLCGKGETFHEVELFCENIDRFRENGPVTMPRDSGEKDPDGFSGIGDFIRKILSLVEERRIGEALEYYERRRAIIGSGKASPELMRIDDLLKKLGASGLFSR